MKNHPAGRISKPFGSEGELVVNLYDTFPAEPDRDAPVWVVVDGLEVPLYFEKFERRGRASAVVRFADIDTPRRAAEMLGREILLPIEVAEDDDPGLEMLIGFTARLAPGLEGRITDFYDSAMNPLFAVQAGGRELLIPAAEEFIRKADMRRRTITFDLPEGLLEMNDE